MVGFQSYSGMRVRGNAVAYTPLIANVLIFSCWFVFRTSVRRGRWLLLSILAWGLWWLYMSLQGVMIVRNLLLLVPFLAIGAAVGASTLWDRVRDRRNVAAPLAIALAGVLVYGAASNLAAAHSIYRYRSVDPADGYRADLTRIKDSADALRDHLNPKTRCQALQT